MTTDRSREASELDFKALIADPMIHQIMKADGIDERELRELFDRAVIGRKARQSNVEATALEPPASEVSDTLRRGIGVMLLNRAAHVFVGQRSDTTDEAWQMPQGGIEPGETPRAAAMRELYEELGTSNVEVLAKTKGWLSYELPRELIERIPAARWKGQRQQWFLMRFLGRDEDINVATEHPEFSKWKWVSPELLVELIVPFKRELYMRVLQEFADFSAQLFQSKGC